MTRPLTPTGWRVALLALSLADHLHKARIWLARRTR
jgi:hypothetical protein